MNPITPVDWSALDADERSAVLRRPARDQARLAADVARIIEAVRERGDSALREYGQRYDGASLDELAVPSAEIRAAGKHLDPALAQALANAARRIERFHDAGRPRPSRVETEPGLVCEARYLPISPVGLYVPGGSAPLVSTVLMLALPARLAGCDEVVLCTPPDRDGEVHPALLAAAALAGVRRVIRAGGAQAIAAMAWGTESVPACAKLFGPGNAWVTEAKRQVSATPGGPAQDLPAGPSEVLVIADDTADPVAVAWDLLSQAEHGADSQAILVSDRRGVLDAVAGALPGLVARLARSAVLAGSLGNLRLILAPSITEAVAISNAYAPEHLILNCRDAGMVLERVRAAGSVFLGPWTPESLGDYSSGTNHVLPTYGAARAFGGLSVADFLRRMTVQCADREALAVAGRDAIELARTEGLEAHAMAVEYRLREATA